MNTRPSARHLVSRARGEVSGIADVLLMGRMFLWACALRVLKHVVRLPMLVRLAHRTADGGQRDAVEEQHVATLARWACRVLDWSSGRDCLERGLVTYRYLSALNARPVLVVGVTMDGNRRLKGHAWVAVDGQPIGETPAAVEEFAQVIEFGAEGRLVKAG